MILTFLALLIACGDKETDTAENTTENTNPYADSPASFTEVNDELLLKSCGFSSCHGTGAGNLVLEAEGNYERIVDVESAFTNEILVIPGDAENSYLFKKVTGADGIEGDLMAPSGAGISVLQEQMLRSWIEAGAQDN